MLHLGDHDPSGINIFDVLDDDVSTFVNQMDDSGTIEFRRIAVTKDQVRELGLSTQERNEDDDRGYVGIFGDTSITCQCEAIPPDELAGIVLGAVEDLTDMDAHQEALDHEEETQEELNEKFSEFMEE